VLGNIEATKLVMVRGYWGLVDVKGIGGCHAAMKGEYPSIGDAMLQCYMGGNAMLSS